LITLRKVIAKSLNFQGGFRSDENILSKLFVKGISVVLLWNFLLNPVVGQESQAIVIRTIGIPPYGILSGKRPSGIYYDTANLLAKEAGYKVQNDIYPYARIIQELKLGRADMTIMFRYQMLDKHVIYIAPLPPLRTVIIGLKESSFDSVDSLRGKTIAYLRGAKFSDEVDNNPDIKKLVTTDFIQGIKMLARRRVDAIIGPLDPIISAIERTGHDQNIFGKPLVIDERTPWVQISKNSVDRISEEQLKTVFHDIERRGALNRIRSKYLGIGHLNKVESTKSAATIE